MHARKLLQKQHISLQNHGTVSHMTMVKCFKKRKFNLNQINDSEDGAEFSIV